MNRPTISLITSRVMLFILQNKTKIHWACVLNQHHKNISHVSVSIEFCLWIVQRKQCLSLFSFIHWSKPIRWFSSKITEVKVEWIYMNKRIKLSKHLLGKIFTQLAWVVFLNISKYIIKWTFRLPDLWSWQYFPLNCMHVRDFSPQNEKKKLKTTKYLWSSLR